MIQPFPKTRTWIAVFVLFVVFGLANIGGRGAPRGGDGFFLQVSRGEKLSLQIADTSFERMRGLSNRSRLSLNEGMLFIFPRSDYHGIWMKDMRFPIDIIWLDRIMTIVDLKENITPDTFPTVFYPQKVAKHVLEVNAGFAAKHALKIGDTLSRI